MTEEHRTDDTRERPSANIERIHQLVETLMPAAAAIMAGTTQLDDPAQQAAFGRTQHQPCRAAPRHVADILESLPQEERMSSGILPCRKKYGEVFARSLGRRARKPHRHDGSRGNAGGGR